MTQIEIATMLKGAGFRVTKARSEVLEFLAKQKHPIGVELMQREFPKTNTTTLYRMMGDFMEKGIVTAHELGHGHLDYELASDNHHHHAVCKSCGLVEEIHACEEDCNLSASIKAASKSFAEIESQTTTFFGTCKQCK
ncbi:MAG: Fur family transcriptional regulator [bacterium]|nr:Fur family transcriptional regulator [bacterium]